MARIEIEYPERGSAHAGNHAYVAGLVGAALQELERRVPESVERVEQETDEEGYLGTTLIAMTSGNRYRVHVEPFPDNVP